MSALPPDTMKFLVVILALVAVATAANPSKLHQRDVQSHCTGPEQYRCDNGECIQEEWVCDTEDDCSDNSDEANCTSDCTGPHKFQCANNDCIASQYRCDGVGDCKDNSDENGCDYGSCLGPVWYRCANGECIPGMAVCDAEQHCSDNSDEANCTSDCIGPDIFQCQGTGAYRPCTPFLARCDGHPDCPLGSDEKDCGSGCKDKYTYTFLCSSSHECISMFRRCDGHNQCADGSDEKDCDTSALCPEGTARCDGYFCRDESLFCNGVPFECSDGLDDFHCPGPDDCFNKNTVSLCARLNETANPICLNHNRAVRFCKEFCNLCGS